MSNLISLHNALRHRKPAQWPEFDAKQQQELAKPEAVNWHGLYWVVGGMGLLTALLIYVALPHA